MCAATSHLSNLPGTDAHTGDVGGQRSLRPYWRNYFEQTDAVVWIVDSGDRMRMGDCRDELHGLLQEDVSTLRLLLDYGSH
jgi:GTPase SAR1 family protein